jgi:hypothetical protein
MYLQASQIINETDMCTINLNIKSFFINFIYPYTFLIILDFLFRNNQFIICPLYINLQTKNDNLQYAHLGVNGQ